MSDYIDKRKASFIRRRIRDSAERIKAAQKERDRLLVEAHASGASLRALAEVAGLSHSRIQQIVNAAKQEEDAVFECVVDESAGLA